MCGRYVIDITDDLSGIKTIIEEAQRRAQTAQDNLVGTGYPIVKTGEVFPGDIAAVLLPPVDYQAAPALRPYPMVWGYPGFKGSSSKIFNTRIEQALQKPLWQDSINTRRCIIPCNGFYEWGKQKIGSMVKKQKYLFRLKDEPLLYMAGIYRRLSARECQKTNSIVPESCFSILTTRPNRLIAQIHDRMPVVLRQSELDQWLKGDWQSLADRDLVELVVSPAA
ncbi:MAG: SOS response-associated peptidase [Coriobacteriaceae bacterium]|nr:SOS response-associated peptidase [Coriobacteriaceae bacterium]